MRNRQIENRVRFLASKFPVIYLSGPRQSGKSTLLKQKFNDYKYISLENPRNFEISRADPEKLLSMYGEKLIIDEAQRNPELFSYIQEKVDELNTPGRFILSGSSNFLLMEKITQTLAGRVGICTLLPFSLKEQEIDDIDEWLLYGGYPRIYDQNIHPKDYYPNYIETYIERDVRQIKNITNLKSFRDFLSVCASRVGQQFEISDIANMCGISVPTVKSWMSILETSYIAFLLTPYYQNFNKRITKTPKLYFYDTGIVCSLLGMTDSKQVFEHESKGHIFENAIIVELLKSRYNAGIKPNFHFWRQSETSEVDLIIDENTSIKAIEIKSGSAFREKYAKTLDNFTLASNISSENKYVVYGGDINLETKTAKFRSWNQLDDLLALTANI